MLRDWRSELNRFLILIAVAIVMGVLTGNVTLLLLLAVMGYLAQRGGASATPAAPAAPTAPAQPDLGGLLGAVIGALARR